MNKTEVMKDCVEGYPQNPEHPHPHNISESKKQIYYGGFLSPRNGGYYAGKTVKRNRSERDRKQI